MKTLVVIELPLPEDRDLHREATLVRMTAMRDENGRRFVHVECWEGISKPVQRVGLPQLWGSEVRSLTALMDIVSGRQGSVDT
jgi:hypothetical protein